MELNEQKALTKQKLLSDVFQRSPQLLEGCKLYSVASLVDGGLFNPFADACETVSQVIYN
jgi:hypothetical protein